MRRALIVAWLVVIFSAPSSAQNHYALEMAIPAVIDTAANGGRDSNNRIYVAHPDIPYNIRATLVGGRYAYRYEGRNLPSGMTLNEGRCTVVGILCEAGTFNWPDPSGTTVTPGVRGCDADDDCTAWVDWTITILATRFRFIDADCSGCDATGDGTLATPWQTYAKAYNTMSAAQILVFIGDAADYTFATLTPATKTDCGVGSINLSEASRPVIWLTHYTTAKPVLDFGDGVGLNAPCVLISGQNVWVDGFEFKDGHNQGFQVGHLSRYGSVFRRNYFRNFGPTPISGGSNPGMINYQQLYGSGGTPGVDQEAIFPIIQNNVFDSGSGEIGGTKLYSTFKAIEENNEYLGGAGTSHQVDWKSDHRQFTSRGSICTGNAHRCLGGNMHGSSIASYGEILHNYYGAISGTGFNYGSIMLNEDSELGQRRVGPSAAAGVLTSVVGADTFAYRNTLVSRVVLWNVDANDGPITVRDNILINANDGATPFDGGYWANSGGAADSWTGTADTSRVTWTGNITESSSTGVIDGSGNLVGAYLTSYGPTTGTPKGHMLGSATSTTPQRIRYKVAEAWPESGYLPAWLRSGTP